MPFTAVDIIIFSVMLLSGLLAVLRGFVREVVTIVTWVGSAFVALQMLTVLGPSMHNLITNAIVADVVTFSIPFFMMLYFLSWAGNKVVLNLSGKEPGPVDGTAGFFFGVARGFIMVTVTYFVFDLLYAPKTAPDWIADAQFEPVIADTTDFYYDLFPALKDESKKKAKKPASKNKEAGKDKGDGKKEKGYSERDRDKIDQLFKDSGGG